MHSKQKILLFSIIVFGFNTITFANERDIKKIVLISTALKDGGKIHSKYTCDGKDISPPLSWKDIPSETESIAIIADDPDAPKRTWVHWVIYNIPPSRTMLDENTPKKETLGSGIKQGVNDFKNFGYGGPCPPSGVHRYSFKIFALDTILELSGGVTKDDLFTAMKGHILAQGRLMGKYERGEKASKASKNS